MEHEPNSVKNLLMKIPRPETYVSIFPTVCSFVIYAVALAVPVASVYFTARYRRMPVQSRGIIKLY